MRDLKELLAFLLGFAPWLLFLFLSGHTLAGLERGLVVSLAASVLFGFRDLRRGFVLAWGSFLFFLSCVFLVNLRHSMWVARNMDILANSFLAGLIWLTLLAGRPFALQYARRDLPRERWDDPGLIRGCRFLTAVWGSLLTFSVAVTVFRRTSRVELPERVYFDISLLTVLAGVAYTTLFKRRRRRGREGGRDASRGLT